jgi:ribosomal-protein-alanine N-acetyltransferase
MGGGATLLRLRLPRETDRLLLARPTLRYALPLRKLLNDREVARWLLHVPLPYSMGDATRAIRRADRRLRSGSGLQLMILEKASRDLRGWIGLQPLDWVHRHAELGYWIGRPFWNRGIATEAVREMVRLAFRDLKLHRLEAATFGGNRDSQGVLRKVGFHPEGVRREAFRVEGRWVDDVAFGIVEPITQYGDETA